MFICSFILSVTSPHPGCTHVVDLCFCQEWPSSLPSLRLSCVPGRLLTTTTTKTPTTRTPSPTGRLTLLSAGAQVSSHSVHLHLIPLIIISIGAIITEQKKPPHLPNPYPNYPSIPRCSDFLLLPQTTACPIPSQERHVSLRSTVARHHPLTVPWVPAAVCSVVGRPLTMTHIHPRPVHLLYPTTA